MTAVAREDTLTFGATQSHGEGAIALVQLPEAGTASVITDHRQLLQDQSLVGESKVCDWIIFTGSADHKCPIWHLKKFEKIYAKMSDFQKRGFRALENQDRMPYVYRLTSSTRFQSQCVR